MRMKLAWVLAAGLAARAGLGQEQKKPVAIVAGRAISEEEFRSAVGSRLVAIETQAYEGRERLLMELIDRRLLEKEAAHRGISPEALQSAEIDAKLPPVTDEEIATVRDQNRERLVGVAEAQATQAIRDAVLTQHRADRRREYLQELRERANVRVLLEVPRVEMQPVDGPTLGPSAAPVTIVEFADFECPYCAQVIPIMKRVREAYGDKVRFVFRDFPLSIHANAGKAAEAGACAREQGKFWEMHDELFKDQRHLGVSDLKNAAKTLGLDVEAFDSCLDSSRHEATWKAESQEGEKYGVTGTPYFFVNGRIVNGVVPFAALKVMIDEELERVVPPSAPKKASP
jgi:predicted DsbA family dithiol-disulfide isomerase